MADRAALESDKAGSENVDSFSFPSSSATTSSFEVLSLASDKTVSREVRHLDSVMHLSARQVCLTLLLMCSMHPMRPMRPQVQNQKVDDLRMAVDVQARQTFAMQGVPIRILLKPLSYVEKTGL